MRSNHPSPGGCRSLRGPYPPKRAAPTYKWYLLRDSRAAKCTLPCWTAGRLHEAPEDDMDLPGRPKWGKRSAAIAKYCFNAFTRHRSCTRKTIQSWFASLLQLCRKAVGILGAFIEYVWLRQMALICVLLFALAPVQNWKLLHISYACSAPSARRHAVGIARAVSKIGSNHK
jgi:hypothetical protein